MCMTESLHCSPEAIILFVNRLYPIQNKKYFFFRKKVAREKTDYLPGNDKQAADSP